MKNLLRKLINWNIRLSQAFDQILPEKYRIDGNRFFIEKFAPSYISHGLKIYDIGGGKQPYITVDNKKALALNITGLDIDQRELNQAPQQAYDQKICADITQFRGQSDADLVICQALLEHVKHVDQAFAAIASILKPDGLALIFVPSRNALYARLNLLLPQGLKKPSFIPFIQKPAKRKAFRATTTSAHRVISGDWPRKITFMLKRKVFTTSAPISHSSSRATCFGVSGF